MISKSESYDYRYRLPPCQDQGLCACCYAHVASAAVDNFLYILYDKVFTTSVQQYIDCSKRPEDPDLSNNGCDWGHYEECALYLEVGLVSCFFYFKILNFFYKM